MRKFAPSVLYVRPTCCPLQWPASRGSPELNMSYVIITLVALPFAAVGGVLLGLATGLIREEPEVEIVAQNYADSWKSLVR